MENITIRKAYGDTDKQTIINLYQFYQYDFSEIDLDDVGTYGLYEKYKYIDSYFTDRARALYFILVDNNLAGFFMMNKYPYLLPEEVNSIAEFFVMRKYRKSGVGLYAAKYIFDNYPGRIIFEVRKKNLKAISFWNKVIDLNKVKQHIVKEENHGNVDWIIHDVFTK